MADFDAARDKILMGAKREEIITEKDKRLTAYHESGHALAAWLTPHADPVHKVTIIPRGRALGVTQFLPEEDRVGINESEVLADLTVALGGRAAERLIYDDLTAGAAGDLKMATRLARMMVTQWGMSERIGPVFFRASEEHPFLGREMSETRDHSEHTAQVIDEEVSRILREADERAFPPARRASRRARAADRSLDRARGADGRRDRGVDRQTRGRPCRGRRGRSRRIDRQPGLTEPDANPGEGSMALTTRPPRRIRMTRLRMALAVVGLVVISGVAWWWGQSVPELPVLARFMTERGAYPLAFSRDGSLLAVSTSEGVVLRNIRTGSPRTVLTVGPSVARPVRRFLSRWENDRRLAEPGRKHPLHRAENGLRL